MTRVAHPDPDTLGDPYHLAGDLARYGAWIAQQRKTPTEWYVDEALPLIVEHSALYGITWQVPALMCWRETDAGRFTGHVTAAMHNPCGLRVEPDLLDQLGKAARDAARTSVRDAIMRASHASFATLDLGVDAFLQHIVAYLGTGHPGFAAALTRGIVDPRWDVIRRFGLAIGVDARAEQLGNAWASNSYGEWLSAKLAEVADSIGPPA